jgi:plasmid maintenance system antidote protein VapI
METKSVTKVIKPSNVLRDWIKLQGINIADFAREVGYSYTHALLISNGTRKIDDATIGRLLRAFGPHGPAWDIAQVVNALHEAEAARHPKRRLIVNGYRKGK